MLEATVPGCSLGGEPEGWGRKRERGGAGLVLPRSADPLIPSLYLALGPPTTFPAILPLPHLKTTQQAKGETIALSKALRSSL